LDEIYLSAKELGQLINKPVRTIENWAAASHIKQNSQGKYGLISSCSYQLAALQEKLERNEQKLEEAAASKDEVRAMAGQRKLIAEADKEEAIAAIKQLELEKLRGTLINAEEAEIAWNNLVINCVAKFSGLPAKLALEIASIQVPQEIQDLLAIAISECLSELGGIGSQ
jgi:hypothetical protein